MAHSPPFYIYIMDRKAFLGSYTYTPADQIRPFTGVEENYLDYIPFGSDNLFPNALAMFARKSPNHRGVINSKVKYCLGDGIFPEDEKNTELQTQIDSINQEGESLNHIQKKLYLDRFMTGNYYIELITDSRRSFLWLNQIDATKCRLSKDSKKIIISPDWSQDTGLGDTNRIVRAKYPDFEADTKGEFAVQRSIFHGFDYEPEFTFYGLPLYIAGKDSVQIDLRTNKWNLGRLKNSFRPGATLIVPVKDTEEGDKVAKNVKKQFTGEENQGKTNLIVKSRALDNEKADQTQYIPHTTEDKGSWIELHKQSTGDIIVAHSWYRALSGIADNAGFDTERILNEYNTALSSVITTEQASFKQVYDKLFREVINQDLEIIFRNSPPLQDDNYKYVHELRAEKGLEVDLNDPQQMLIVVPGVNKNVQKQT